MERLTNNKTYCEEIHCDLDKYNECFFDSEKEQFECFEQKMYEKLKEYEELGTVEEFKELIGKRG